MDDDGQDRMVDEYIQGRYVEDGVGQDRMVDKYIQGRYVGDGVGQVLVRTVWWINTYRVAM